MPEYEQTPIQILASRRENAISEAEKRTNELHSKLPQVLAIDNELSNAAYRMFELRSSPESMNEFAEAAKLASSARENILKNNGYPADYDKPVFFCKKCNDTGYVKLEKCVCLKELENGAYRKSALGDGLQEFTFDKFSLDYYDSACKELMEINLENCREYAEKFTPKSKSLIFTGGTGLGKTHLSVAIGHIASMKGYTVVYESVQKIISDYRRSQFTSAFDAIDKYYDCVLLIIDDLGTELRSEFSVSALTEIINRRMILGLPTVISTNFSLENIKKEYGARLYSRILGNFVPINFVGKDIRFKKIENC